MKWVAILILLITEMLCPLNSQAASLASVDKAITQIFSTSDYSREEVSLSPEQIEKVEKLSGITFAGSHQSTIIRYEIKKDGVVKGFAYEDVVMGKWGPIHYLAGLDLHGSVLQVVILDYQEIRGKPIAKKRFLNQYIGKNITKPMIVGKDIDGITGATISSRSLTDGIRKILYIFSLK